MKEEDVDAIVRHLVCEKGLARQQIDSFNFFVEEEIQKIVKANEVVDSDIDHNFYLKYTGIRVSKPTIEENMITLDVSPNECRLRDLTYSGNIYVDIEYTKNKKIIVKKNVFVGKVPIMLRSSLCHLSEERRDFELIREAQKPKECPLDMGGYFIIKGAEKVILIQEQLSKNRVIVDTDNKGNKYTSVISSTHDKKSKTSIIMKKGIVYLKNNVFTENIPVIFVLKALGMTSDKEISEFIGIEERILELLEPSIEEAAKLGVYTRSQAEDFISNFVRQRTNTTKLEEARTALYEVVLSNIPSDGVDMRRKAIAVAMMVRFLLQAELNIISTDDIDFLGNKRFELAGNLLSILFEDTFLRFNGELKKSIDKVLSKSQRAQEFDALTFLNLQVNLISNSFIRAISTGNWTVKRFRMERAGITQVLSRLSYISMVGMMTKVQSQFEKTRKISGPRSLHTSFWGMLCPSDTPEGEGCGLVKNLAILAEITTDVFSEEVERSLFRLGIKDFRTCSGHDFYSKSNYPVLLNGTIVGICHNKEALIRSFIKLRRRGEVHRFVSIYKNDEKKTVSIATDSGRICRPLFVVENGKLNLNSEDIRLFRGGYKTLEDLFKEGKVEFLDVNEENDKLIALKEDEIGEDTTHMEICEYAILGYVAGTIPYPHHNQSPRNTYQCAMGKQAMGFIATNQYKRFDVVLNLLVYPQRSLVSTKIARIANFESLPAGQNGMVAVMSYSGYDIEDALVLNKASLERGFGRCEVYRSYKHSLKRYTDGSSDRISGNRYGDGIKAPGERVFGGDFLVYKESPANETEFKFTGELYKSMEPSMVDKVVITKSGDDLFTVKTCLRQTRIPEVGDKFSSRHGQKGVVGMIAKDIDMPFSEEGVIPDIIMNPHGFPSRMTVGKIMELISGKASALSGKSSDSTIFCEDKIEYFSKVLVENGYSYCGKDTFMNGATGEIYEGYIFFGPIYYQRLKHMVSDKMHARARGPRAMLTRQPTEGRSKDGGLRLGEMERDCLIGYGASSLISERLMTSSDLFKAYVCHKCGVIVYKTMCTICKRTDPVPIDLPYACKLLFQELISMNILPKIKLK